MGKSNGNAMLPVQREERLKENSNTHKGVGAHGKHCACSVRHTQCAVRALGESENCPVRRPSE